MAKRGNIWNITNPGVYQFKYPIYFYQTQRLLKAQEISESEQRKEYMRIRKAAKQRIRRLEAEGYSLDKIPSGNLIKALKTSKGMTHEEIVYGLIDLRHFMTKSTSLSEFEKYRRFRIERYNKMFEQWDDFGLVINDRNLDAFEDYLNEMRKYGYDSETVVEYYVETYLDKNKKVRKDSFFTMTNAKRFYEWQQRKYPELGED